MRVDTGNRAMRALQATAARRRRELRSRTLFTKPLTPVAGQPVEIYYNPGGALPPSVLPLAAALVLLRDCDDLLPRMCWAFSWDLIIHCTPSSLEVSTCQSP